MVTIVKAPTSVLMEPGAPAWAQRFALRLAVVFKLVNPQAPVAIWPSYKADLPPPIDWIGSLVYVPDQDCVAISDGVNWRKISLGGPV